MTESRGGKTIRVLVVDDEPAARGYLCDLLAGESDVEVIGRAANGYEAVEAITADKPDLVFLDVQMPEMDGFDVLAHLGGELPPQVIFVTAYDRYALKAFEVSALDYLLKPFDRPRFAAALNKARSAFAVSSEEADRERIRSLLARHEPAKIPRRRLLVKSRGRLYFLRAEDISHIAAADNYVVAHAGSREHVLRESLSRMETKLDPERFVRIHRSTIVNLDFIREIEPSSSGDYAVRMVDDTKLILSRKHKTRFFQRFSG